jgi:hypothetical protein
MEVLKLTTEIDASGYLTLNVPTQMAPGMVNLVVVVNPAPAVPNPQSSYDFSDLAGQLTWQGDAIAVQRTLRDEW